MVSGSVTSVVKAIDQKSVKDNLKESSKFEYLVNKARRGYENVNEVQAKIVNKAMLRKSN